MTSQTPALEQHTLQAGYTEAQALALLSHALDQREAALTTREKLVEQREKAVLLQEDAIHAKETLAEHTAAQLREANERLVVATVQAHTLTEAAEGATAQMAYMAQHDHLTGLPNRALLSDRLTQSIALAQRHNQKVVLAYLDLDNFKNINDTLGHTVGDALLQAVAQRLSGCVRQSDTVCRQGGDEFVLLLAGIETAQDAARAAAMLVEACFEPYQVGEHLLRATASIGLSVYPDDGSDEETLVRHADIAMYHAKKNGRSNVQMFSSEMEARTARPASA